MLFAAARGLRLPMLESNASEALVLRPLIRPICRLPMRRPLAAVLVLCLAGMAHAQLRALPAQAKLGEIRHVQEMVVQIDGKLARLSRGAQVRDAHNRILVPAAIPAGSLVRYTLDAQGEVSAVWILTAHEAEQPSVTLPAPAPTPAKPVPLPAPAQ